MNYNSTYLNFEYIWNYMRDAYHGEDAIKAGRQKYIWRKKGMNDDHFDFLIYNGRYPEIISRVIRQSVDRILSKDPKSGFSTLSKYTDDPYNLLVWLLTETALMGGATLTLNLNGIKPKIIPYTIENTINWSNTSVALNDMFINKDEYGFDDETESRKIILHMVNDIANITTIDEDDSIINSIPLEWNNKFIPFIPATRMMSINKPLFYGMAKLAEHYYRKSADRGYILSLIVPQPVLTLPPAEEAKAWETSSMYNAEENLQYGANTLMTLPHGASFKIETASVRNIAELRQELNMIKDEMTVQGAKIYLETGARSYTTSAETLKIQAEEDIVIFNDIIRQVENAINNIFYKISVLEQEDLEKFEFSKIEADLSDISIKDIIDSETFIGKDAVRKELADRGVGEDEVSEVVENYLDNDF